MKFIEIGDTLFNLNNVISITVEEYYDKNALVLVDLTDSVTDNTGYVFTEKQLGKSPEEAYKEIVDVLTNYNLLI